MISYFKGLGHGRNEKNLLRAPVVKGLSVVALVVATGFSSGCAKQAAAPAIAPAETDALPEKDSAPNALPDSDCEPACDERECGSDLCGSVCGACDPGELCAPGGTCVPEDSLCTESCADRGQECGDVCGESCGACTGAQEQCIDGQCTCRPDCNGQVCGAADGCGGTCSPCPVDFNCVDCPFKLEVTEKVFDGDALTHLTLKLTYAPPHDARLPVMADFKLKAQGPVAFERLGLGQALMDAGKKPLIHPHTGASYQRLDPETYRFIFVSTENTQEIEAGHWLSLRFAVGDTAADGPAIFKLLQHGQILAPLGANAIDFGDFENPIVIWPGVSDAQ